MAKETFTLSISQDMCDYLQRLHYDIETRMNLIDKIFVIHQDDKDTKLFDSVPWKKYYSELEEVTAEYEIAKLKLQEDLGKRIVENHSPDTVFSWEIKDFLIPEVTIVIEG